MSIVPPHAMGEPCCIAGCVTLAECCGWWAKQPEIGVPTGILLLSLYEVVLSCCVASGRAGAEAPQQQAQQEAQPSGELSDNGEENTAPQPQADSAGVETAQHASGGMSSVHGKLTPFAHFPCLGNQRSGASVSHQIDMRAAC